MKGGRYWSPITRPHFIIITWWMIWCFNYLQTYRAYEGAQHQYIIMMYVIIIIYSHCQRIVELYQTALNVTVFICLFTTCLQFFFSHYVITIWDKSPAYQLNSNTRILLVFIKRCSRYFIITILLSYYYLLWHNIILT